VLEERPVVARAEQTQKRSRGRSKEGRGHRPSRSSPWTSNHFSQRIIFFYMLEPTKHSTTTGGYIAVVLLKKLKEAEYVSQLSVAITKCL
jgi:hypothetical protein